jgi:hypothetical protein
VVEQPNSGAVHSDERLHGQQGSTRKIKGMGELLTSRGDSRALESTAVEPRLRGEKASERRPDKTEELGANQRVSRVAGEETKLNEATDVTEAR